MIISDQTLKSLIKSNELKIDPLTEKSIQPASIDCRLGNHFLVLDEHKSSILTMTDKINYRELVQEEIIIPPKSFVLGTTLEYMELPSNITAFVEGRSSIGRMGLFIENAGWVDPGFKGKITLELYNANSLPIKLIAGRRICQMVFCFMDKPALEPYGTNKHGGKYQGQTNAVGSLISDDGEAS